MSNPVNLHIGTGPTHGRFCRALILMGLAFLSACVTKTPAPAVPDALVWQQGGYIAGQVNGFTRDSFRINENYSYSHFLDPFQTHYRIDTIVINAQKQPLYIFDLTRFDDKTRSYIHLRFGMDSLKGRVRRPSVHYPQYGGIYYITKGPGNDIITYQTEQEGIYGTKDDVIQISDLVYNEEVNRLLGSFKFREYLGQRDTNKVYGPEVKGNFDLFVKRKLR